MEWTREGFFISTDKELIDIDHVHGFLTSSYWAEGISREIVERSIAGSMCFSIFNNSREQVGFARVITDSATFAYLADVFVDENYRGRGLSHWLVQCIVSYPPLTGLRRFLLATRDAHGLYEKSGFKRMEDPTPWMHIHRPDLYKKEGA